MTTKNELIIEIPPGIKKMIEAEDENWFLELLDYIEEAANIESVSAEDVDKSYATNTNSTYYEAFFRDSENNVLLGEINLAPNQDENQKYYVKLKPV